MIDSREEHIKHCKKEAYRAYEYHLSGKEYSDPTIAIRDACLTMISDLSKHPSTSGMVTLSALLISRIETREELFKFIEGFN